MAHPTHSLRAWLCCALLMLALSACGQTKQSVADAAQAAPAAAGTVPAGAAVTASAASAASGASAASDAAASVAATNTADTEPADPNSGTADPAATPAAQMARDLPAGQQRRGLPSGAMRVQLVQVMDANGFERPMPAYYAFVPLGWRATGGVQWGQQFACTNGFNYNWVAQSPDGTQKVAVLPQQKWETNNYGGQPTTPGCPSAGISSIQQYLQQIVSGVSPDARITTLRPRMDLARKFRHLNVQTPTATGGMRTWVEAGEAQLTYTHDGRPMQAVITATVVFSMMRNSALGQGQTLDALTGFAFPAFAASAPAGELNLQFAEAVRQSFLPNPDWEARIARHNTAIFQVDQAEARKRSQAISEYNDYVSRIRQETADMRAQSDERRQRQFGEAIKGTKTYDDPNAAGGRTELSNLYDHAWRLNDGTYVLSNDSGFEPFRDLGLDGKRLEATQ